MFVLVCLLANTVYIEKITKFHKIDILKCHFNTARILIKLPNIIFKVKRHEKLVSEKKTLKRDKH